MVRSTWLAMVVLGLVESAKAYYPEDWCFAAEVMSELINSTGTGRGSMLMRYRWYYGE
jgi:hypothetical protein